MTIQGRIENGHWVPEEKVPQVSDPTSADDPKNKRVSAVPLSRLAREVIDAVPIVDADSGLDLVFSLDGKRAIKSWSKLKDRLDRKMLAILRGRTPTPCSNRGSTATCAAPHGR